MKKFFKKYWLPIVIIVCLALFIIITIFTKNDNDTKTVTLKSSVSEWSELIEEDQYVVTVIAATTCSWCNKYKPIMKSIAGEYDFNIFWFEVDKLSEDNYNKVIYSFELADYSGTPHTYIVKNGELVAEQGGYVEKTTLKEFLKENNVIK